MKKKNLLVLPLVLISLVACGSTSSTSASDKTSSSSSDKTSSSISTSVENNSSVSSSESSSISSSNDGKTEYVFEAEYSPDIENLEGQGYSGTAVGTNMIVKDWNNDYGTSNDNYLTYLYRQGITVTFTINSDKAVTDAILTWRVSCEYKDVTLSPSMYLVNLNGTGISYSNINLTIDSSATTSSKMAPFSDHVLTSSMSLKQGENVFSFVTMNSTAMMGTMYATAPIFDCFKIKTDAVLTWNPCTDNLL